MDYHTYESLYNTIKEQYSRPDIDEDKTETTKREIGFMSDLFNQTDIAKSLESAYNIPTIDNLLNLSKTVLSTEETQKEKQIIKDDIKSYIYIHNLDL